MNCIATCEVRAGRREVIVDHLLARLTVVGDAQLADLFEVIFLIRHRAIRLEEHVLVEVRQAVQLGRLSVRAVLDGQLDCHERHGMIFEDDHFQAVGEHAIDELGLRQPGGRGSACGLLCHCCAAVVAAAAFAARRRLHELTGARLVAISAHASAKVLRVRFTKSSIREKEIDY